MKVSGISQFIIVIVAFSAHVIVCRSLQGNETDRLSLLDFKNAISLDPQQSLLSWNDSTHFCNWKGVRCRIKNPRRVISLVVENQGLVGEISPSLGNLTFLKHLSLPTNSFTGEIPSSLGHLHRLQSLYLSNNTLWGRVPDLRNCSDLMVLWLDNNELAGQFPSHFPLHLQELQLKQNNLTGTLPASLANITTLSKFGCAHNTIQGNLPNDFATFPVLELLYLSGNQLGGKFPQAILNLSTLVGINLGLNHISGEIPFNFGNSLPKLEQLELAANFFQGNIPSSITNATNMNSIDLSRNNFTGVVPSSIGKLSELTDLNLELNQLQARSKQDWEFMSTLANCTELKGISLLGNRLEGHVPNTLGNLSVQLQRLYLGENQLSGGFPTGIINHPSLIVLSLAGNQFSGIIPTWFGTLKSLQMIDLGDNSFTGSIPSSLSNLTQLSDLLLGSNQFDVIPTSLGNLQMLETLHIDNNNLQGVLPKEIFNIPTVVMIILSFNNIVGQLPTEVGNSKQLNYLDLSFNNLSGDIPNTLSDCESLEYIMLDKNIFSGSIPTSLGNISSLKFLNISHNNLTGPIPMSLGNLQLLEQLDLSFNHLNGEVPTKGIFKNATAMRINGNDALCSGISELHLPSCFIMAPNSTKHKLSLLLKLMVPLGGVVLFAAMAMSAWLLRRRKQKRKSISLPSFGSKFPKVSYNDLAKATNGFSATNLIGTGRYSSVYHGKIFEDGNIVAIKVFRLETRGAQKSFMTECNALRNARHRNLVPILTACASIDSKGNDFKALLYQFMPRGDLHALLYSTGDGENSLGLNRITLAQRLSIVVDVSDAMEYLHHNNQQTIVHCDLKPSNILLDANMTAHVGDFGLSKLKLDLMASSFGDSTSSMAINGTIGYVAPEYATGGQASTFADVYSFGIVLLELFLRKRPTDDMFKDGLTIAKFVELNVPDRILDLVDPELLQGQEDFSNKTLVNMEVDMKCLLSVINIGLCCTKQSPSERMDMQEVAAKLHGINDAYIREI
uniref:Receptor kinase-like protein Xa21 n=1 Tax=Oryza barthii TaxID=65489 RepID=A0A0D3HNN5_9ORYZ